MMPWSVLGSSARLSALKQSMTRLLQAYAIIFACVLHTD
jgi:hypothetical protein